MNHFDERYWTGATILLVAAMILAIVGIAGSEVLRALGCV